MSLSLRHWLAERHIDISQLGHTSAEIAGVAFRLAQDMEVKSLTPFSISALTDVLELPMKAAWQLAPVISQLSMALLRLLSRKKPLRRNEGTWLTFHIAYLNALQGILEQEAQVRRPWLDRAKVPLTQDADQPLNDPPLVALLKTLRPGRLSDSQAEQALSLVAESFLVQQMNNLAIAWFVANGAEETEAKLLVQRLNHRLPGHLLVAIAENPLPLAQLQKFVRLGNLSSLRDTTSKANADVDPEPLTTALPLSLSREYYRAELACALSEPLLAETFALKDLYIPLRGKQLTGWRVEGSEQTVNLQSEQAQPSVAAKLVNLMDWTMSQLEDKTTITVIAAEPGGGKTSFCQMFASQVAQELYPNWMPVLIRLKDVTLGQTLEQSLETACPEGRFTDTDGWFSPNSPPCVLILDGLDELSGSTQAERHLWTFMDQVMQFYSQTSSTTNLSRHKIILTSRSNRLDCLGKKYRQSSSLPSPVPLRGIVIAPMEQEEFRQWFQQWAKLQSKSIAQAYFTFLKHGGVFQARPTARDLAALVKHPLMLYLLGILHRDAWVDESIFLMGASQVKFEIYDRICRWLLGEPAAGKGRLPELTREGLAHATRSLEAIANLLQERYPQDLRRKMQVAALTILQTDRYQASQSTIQPHPTVQPLTDVLSLGLPAFFFRSLHKGRWGDNRQAHRQGDTANSPVNFCASPPLPLSTSSATHLGIEFSHLSLGEYLGAEEIATQLTILTQQVQDQYGQLTFVIQSPVDVARHLYALLGYGLLSFEIEELVVERLRREQERNPQVFSFAILFERLYRFYRAYCCGQWMDEGIAYQAHSQLQALHNPLTVLQIDAVVGLNVFLLLCAGAKETQILFWPCGNPDIRQDFEPTRLLSFIGRCAAFSPTAFWRRIRQRLGKVQLAQAYLNHTMLAEANLSQANLSSAELMGINLAAANLQTANLSWANLTGANLSNANLSGASLEGADLSGANLKGANFQSANLSHACLFQAQLDEQTKNFAIKSGAIFSLEEFQAYNKSLVQIKIIDNLEDERLLEEEPTIFIESAEGEPMLPDERYESHWHDDYYNAETAAIEALDQQQLAFSDEDDASVMEDTVVLYDPTRDDIDQ
jgi:hypothetical protein